MSPWFISGSVPWEGSLWCQRGSHDNNLHVYLDATETRECWCDLCWHRPLRRACVAPYRLWRAVTLTTLRGLYSSVSFKYTCAHSQTHEQTTCPAPQLARRSSQSSLHSKAPAAGSVAWWRGSSRHLPHARHRRTRNRSAADWEGLGAAGLADQRGGTSDGEPARQIATMSGV